MGPAFMRKYATGAGADIYIPIIKAGVQDFAVGGDWTPVTGDVKISIDGGGQADIDAAGGALPTYANGSWVFTFTNAQLTGKKISVRIVDSATKAVEDQAFEIETFGHASALYPTDFSAAVLPVDAIQISGDAAPADALETMFDGTGGATMRLGNLFIFPTGGPGVEIGAFAGEAAVVITGVNGVNAVQITGVGTGAALDIEGGSGGNGVIILGGGAAAGLWVQGGATGIGVDIAGGATSGKGVRIRSLGNNDNAFEASAHGIGIDIEGSFNPVERDAIASALLDLANGVETGFTLRQVLRALAAAVAGECSGAGTGTIQYQMIGGATVRITSDVDLVGNRSNIVLNL